MSDPERIERLLLEFKESLTRQIRRLNPSIGTGFSDILAKMDRQGARLDRQLTAMEVSCLTAWARQVDRRLAEQDREIADLRRRLDRLESNGSKGPGEQGPA
jgi:hypothetical protein